MNKTLPAKPEFQGDHFVFGLSPGVGLGFRAVVLLSGCSLAGVAGMISSDLKTLAEVLWLISVILILTALAPRIEWSSVVFICDHSGCYFPSRRANTWLAQRTDLTWLHVPWHNISAVGSQLILDESANRQGVVFSVVATPEECAEFLNVHHTPNYRTTTQSDAQKSIPLGFSSVFHRHDDVVEIIKHFRSTGSRGADFCGTSAGGNAAQNGAGGSNL